MSDLPRPPNTGNPDLDRYLADLTRKLDVVLDKLGNQHLMPTFSVTRLPNVSLPAKFILAVGTGTGTAQRIEPAFNNGTAWRGLGTGTAL